MEFFLLDTLKTTFCMEDLTQGWTQLEPFFQTQGTFFDFQKRVGEAYPPPPPPSYAPALTKAALRKMSKDDIITLVLDYQDKFNSTLANINKDIGS